jgi:hypothetical protein
MEPTRKNEGRTSDKRLEKNNIKGSRERKLELG